MAINNKIGEKTLRNRNERESTQINKVRNKQENIATDRQEIQNIIRE